MAVSTETPVESLIMAQRMGLISPQVLVARLVQLIDEQPAREREALLETLRGDGRPEVQVAVSEYQWRIEKRE